MRKSFSKQKKVLILTQKIINFSNEKMFHTGLKEPIYYSKKIIY